MRWIEVAAAKDVFEAKLIQGFLQEAGVEVRLRDCSGLIVHWAFEYLEAPFLVEVPAEQVATAKALLDRPRPL